MTRSLGLRGSTSTSGWGPLVGLLFAAIYILVNLACIGYFLREGRSEFNPIKHVVVPILGVIAMIPAVLAVIGGVTIPILDIELAPYENSLRYTAPVVGVWVLLGLVVYFVLRMRNPAALDRVDDVYGGDDAPAVDPVGLTRCGPAVRRRPVALPEDAQRAVGRDHVVRHVHDLADAQVDHDAAQQVGLHRLEAVLATEPLDHAAQRVPRCSHQVRPDAVGGVARLRCGAPHGDRVRPGTRGR